MVEITLSGNPLDRAHHRRLDETWLAAVRRSPAARFAVFAQDKPLLKNGAAAFLTQPELARLRGPEAPGLFLGLAGEVPYFALELDPGPAEAAGQIGRFIDFRLAMGSLPADEVAILGEARGLFNWHARHKFCAHCGAASTIAEGGWKRVCDACGAEHFPRTDPVVIMLATAGDAALLGRNIKAPAGMYSCLAGFMEPGETIEEAVAREVKEEAGIRVGAVRYIASQPWPFPSSLMIGCLAEALSAAIRIDETELDDARWFSRAEIRDALSRPMSEGPFWVPAKFAIAHQLMRVWVAET
jgi:NAD+ diphosphatase